jgi:hypothetical protein
VTCCFAVNEFDPCNFLPCHCGIASFLLVEKKHNRCTGKCARAAMDAKNGAFLNRVSAVAFLSHDLNNHSLGRLASHETRKFDTWSALKLIEDIERERFPPHKDANIFICSTLLTSVGAISHLSRQQNVNNV